MNKLNIHKLNAIAIQLTKFNFTEHVVDSFSGIKKVLLGSNLGDGNFRGSGSNLFL